MDFVLSQNDLGLGHCNFVDEELERVGVGIVGVVVDIVAVEVVFGSCMIVEELDELEQQFENVHRHGKLGYSNVHHMSRHRIGLMYRIDLYMLVHCLDFVDIVVEELELVEREGQLEGDHR